MIYAALALALVCAASAMDFDSSVADTLQDFDIFQIGKDGQFNTCNTKTFAMVMDTEVYGTDKLNLAKYCALYCRNFVDEDTTHVNLDDRTDKGGTFACYCSNDCDDICEGTHTYESTTITVEATDYSPLAYYYNTYYYSSYWQYPYYDDSQFGRPLYFSYTGPNTGYNLYNYYYVGTHSLTVSWTLMGTDYAYSWDESTSTTDITFTQWTIDCDDGTTMDLRNDAIADQTADYGYDDGSDTDYSSYTRFDVAGGSMTETNPASCQPVKLFKYGAVSYSLSWPNQLSESQYYGQNSDTAEGVTAFCGEHTSQDECEGVKVYSYGGYGASSSSSSNFGYSYYYDGTSIYHGSSSNPWGFDWDLTDQSVYGSTFTYYYYYYSYYVYPCDWSYESDDEDASATAAVTLSSFLHASFSLYAVMDKAE